MFGRRLSIIVACIGGGALLYPYCFVRSDGVIGAAFWEQFFVQGVCSPISLYRSEPQLITYKAWGVIPIHLVELSPAGARTTIVGTAYQLGNLASSASSTIEATMGERFRLSGDGETERYNYGLVMAIFMGCVFAYVILLVFLGPEKLGRDMSESTTEEEFSGKKGVGEGGWDEKVRADEDEGRESV